MKCFLILRAVIPTIIFNLRHLPLRQAVKLPFFVYKIRDLGGKGVISFECPVKAGMIKLGFPRAATHANNGVTWRNKGKIIFKGKCVIGNDCSVIVGKYGKLIFGDCFHVNAGMKLVSECSITFGKNVLLGWDVTLIDTNFHYLYDLNLKQNRRAYGPIVIGDNNWIATQCLVLNGVTTADGCVFGARAVLTRGCNYEPFCLYGGSPIQILTRGVMRVRGKDGINDYSVEE